ncbi:ATP-dependent DNA helicase yku80 [Saxophila tyrrhenica]|uniref:ATP-dependent DNA helicase II subunit 2 n=1 Tax=Saxophila tyrrhenica TaxID=1690608 RepID=A0AAV9PKX1_9PEZI|nr:ATP-dependent DNA helicase yku80 [Saxophila tyrrhenica]
MAGKEATVYIVDCGLTMGERSHGRKETNLEWALEYVWDRITSTVATGRKTALAGVVGLRTDGTSNAMEDSEGYEHISVLQELGQVLMPHIRTLAQNLVVSSTNAGDAISALAIAVGMIVKQCKKLQYARKIVLITDARGNIDAEDLSQIVSKMNADNMELVVLGVDFDDPEYGFKEEDKDSTKADNEEILRALCNDCATATFGTLAQAIDELGVPRVRSTKPVPSYKGSLTLGNPAEYETALTIAVERYPKVMQAKPPTASKFVMRGDMAATQPTQASSTLPNGEAGANDGLAGVKQARTYQVVDENAAGGKKDVEYDELSKGYEYGRTAVHISESDQNVTNYETTASFDIVGFVDKNKYERYLDIDRSNLIVGAKHEDKTTMALSSLIHSLYELESYAVARLVAKDNKGPRLQLLAPHIEPDFECLYDIELPFAEDVRSYRFPPLDRVVTVSGKTLSVHRNLPSDELQDAMSSLVDSMDLSTFGKDDEGNEAEYAPLDETYSPMLHRINQVTKHRAVHQNDDPPEPYEILTRYAHPPAELVKQSHKQLDRAIKAADVKKVPPKARGKRFGRKGREEKPLSDLDVGALLATDPKRNTKRIDPKNAIPEFKQFLSTGADDLAAVQDAVKQLKNIIFDWIKHSFGDSGYGKAVEAIRVMREEMNDLDRPAMYNDVMQELKQKLAKEELGGDGREMWFLIRKNRLGLIAQAESSESEITEGDANDFMNGKLHS